MNFQQLRSVREAVRQDYNLTRVAETLFTSQPGISRQIRELEEELGMEIFERYGKRLIGMTDPGKEILRIIERLLLEAENLGRAGKEFTQSDSGTLSIATTHTQARYSLPQVILNFRAAFPDVRIALHQTSPNYIAALVGSGEADIGIATEGLTQFDELVSLPSYSWSHTAVVHQDHPLATVAEITLPQLASYPLITYDKGFTGRGHIDEAFASQGITPDIVLTAMDSDVIQQYALLGLGVGIVASMAVEQPPRNGLKVIDTSHLFARNITRIAVRKGAYLRSYAYEFIHQFAPEIDIASLRNNVLGEA